MRLKTEINRLLRFFRILSPDEIREIHLVEFERNVRTLGGIHTEHATGWRVITPTACILDIEDNPAASYVFEGSENNKNTIAYQLLSRGYNDAAICSILDMKESELGWRKNNE